MSMESVYLEIQQSINSGAVASLSKEKLAQFSAALSRSQAYAYFGASEFPQVCETVRALLIARSTEEALAKIPNPTPQPSPNNPNRIHDIGVGAIIVVVGAAAIWVIAHYLGIQL
jgi:hypothetical protein